MFKDIIDVMKGSRLGEEESKEFINKDDLTNYSKVLSSSNNEYRQYLVR